MLLFFLTLLFDLHYKTCERLVAWDQHLVRNSRGHMGNVAGAQFLACATLNGCAANFSGADLLGIDDCTAGDQCGATLENTEQVSKVFVQLGDSIAGAK